MEPGREQFEVNFLVWGKELLRQLKRRDSDLGQNCKALSQGRAANALAEILFADTVGEAASLLAPVMRAGDVICFRTTCLTV